MHMTLNVLLIIIFLGIVVGIWVLLSFGEKAAVTYQKQFTESAESNLEKMFVFFDYKKMFFTNVGILIFVPFLVYLITGGIFYAVIVAIAIFAAPKIILKVMEAKRKKQIVEALPDALAQIAGSMRSGSTFTSSIENMVNETKGPISQEFGLLLKEQKIGISPQEALENLGDRIGSEDFDLVVTASLIAREVGGNLSETFERLSTMLRQKIEMEGKIDALTAQGKVQGVVVGALPFGIIGVLSFVEPEGMMPIFSTYLGWGFLAVIIILEIMGALMIKKIVTIDI